MGNCCTYGSNKSDQIDFTDVKISLQSQTEAQIINDETDHIKFLEEVNNVKSTNEIVEVSFCLTNRKHIKLMVPITMNLTRASVIADITELAVSNVLQAR